MYLVTTINKTLNFVDFCVLILCTKVAPRYPDFEINGHEASM